MSKPNLQFPVIEMVGGEDMHEALVRVALRRKVTDVDTFLATHIVDSRVAYGTVNGSMMATAVVLSAKPRPHLPSQAPTDTPTPTKE
jgi:hypothetical protein